MFVFVENQNFHARKQAKVFLLKRDRHSVLEKLNCVRVSGTPGRICEMTVLYQEYRSSKC